MKKNILILIPNVLILLTMGVFLYLFYLSDSFTSQHEVIMILLMCFLVLGICYITYRYVISNARIQNISYAKNKEILESVMEISDSILVIEDTQQLFDLVLEKAVTCIDDAKMGSLLIVNDHQELEFKAMVGYDLNKFKNLKLQIEDCFLYKYNNGDVSRACIIRNVQEFDKKFLNKVTYDKLHDANAFLTKATISAPIKIDNKFYGIINIDSDNLHGFTDIDVSFMEYFAAQISTVIRNHELLEKMLYLSRHDHLTGLFNRYYFEEIFETMFSRAERYQENFSLLMFDLDNLKITNDSFGHQIGDQLIQRFAMGLKKSTRKSDIIARYGGDEFIVACLYTNKEDVKKIINKLNIYFIENPLNIGNMCVYIEFSYGAANYPSDGKELKTLFKVADDRMYENKEKHKMKIHSKFSFTSHEL